MLQNHEAEGKTKAVFTSIHEKWTLSGDIGSIYPEIGPKCWKNKLKMIRIKINCKDDTQRILDLSRRHTYFVIYRRR